MFTQLFVLKQEWMSMPNPDLENPIPTSLRSTVLCTGGRILHFFAPSSAQVAEFCIFLHFFCTVLCTGGRILHFLHFFCTLLCTDCNIFHLSRTLHFFLLRRGAWWGGPLGFLMAGAPYLTLKFDNNSEVTWIFETQRYLASNNANEKNNILGALSCTGEVWLLQKYLDMSIK